MAFDTRYSHRRMKESFLIDIFSHRGIMNIEDNSIKCQMRILNKKRIAGVPSTTVVTRVRHKSRGVNYIVLCSLRHRRGKVWANIFGLLEKK